MGFDLIMQSIWQKFVSKMSNKLLDKH